MEERTIEITLQEYMELLQCRLRNETVVKLLDAEILYAPSSVGTAIKAILTGAAGWTIRRSACAGARKPVC